MNKRLGVACFILGAAVLLTVFSHARIHTITDQMCAGLLQIRQTAVDGDYERAASMLDELLNRYDTQQHFLEFFIKRETVLSAAVNLHGLRAYVRPDSTADLCSEIDKAYTQLQMMEHLFTAIV